MVARRHRASTVQGWTTLRLTMLGTSAEEIVPSKMVRRPLHHHRRT
jgi:hypothetical protein